jgi:hypothetical protein
MEYMMSTSLPLDHQNTDHLNQGNWMYLPTLPVKLEEAIEWLLSDPRPSRNQNFDEYKDSYVQRAWRVIKETYNMIDILSLPPVDNPQKAKWEVNWLTLEWTKEQDLEWPKEQDKEDLVLASSTLPPFRYQIQIVWTAQDLTEYELFITPIHFRLITRLDEELSRRIGDELDGPTP